MKNLILIGMRGVGKTTLGKALSLKTGFTAIDTDEEVAKLYHQKTGESKTPKEIFHKGEKGFRLLEEEVIASLKKGCGMIISLGGGSTLSPLTREVLPKMGRIVCLFLDKKKLLERWEKISFSLPEGSFDRWYEERLSHYRENSCVWVRADAYNLLDVLIHIWNYGKR